MFVQHKAPLNVPNAVVDFVELLTEASKNPAVLQPFVDAAKEIQASAGSVDEVNAAMASAQDKIDQAVMAAADIKRQKGELAAREEYLGKRMQDVAKREDMIDKLSNQLNEQNGVLAAREAAADETQRKQDERAKALFNMAAMLDKKEADLEAREKAVQEQEDNLSAAQYLAEKGSITGMHVTEPFVRVSKKRFCPDTGAALADEVVTVNIDELKAQLAEFQSYIDNVQAFLMDVTQTPVAIV